MSEYFRIPSLGQHYTQRWAKEELENERQKSAAGPGNNVGGGTGEGGAGPETEVKQEAGKLLAKAESSTATEAAPFGELTQRFNRDAKFLAAEMANA